MNKIKFLMPLAALCLLAGLTSCSNKLGALSADNFTVTPLPLEEEGGKVPFVISGHFPEKYMKRNATVQIVPYLAYANTVELAQPSTFQGEKVQGNDQEISYRLGGNFTMRCSTDFKNGMQNSNLLLHFIATVGNKKVEVPDVKIGYGVISTSSLLAQTLSSANCAVCEDKYQYAISQQQQAQIKYLVQQTNIRTSELNSTSVQDFIKTLRTIKEDQKSFQIENIDISSYASPEGSIKLNTELAKGRDKNSADYVNQELKKNNLEAGINTRYTAEDWEGFQELVSRSNIQDKEVILSVLSMYTDPQERETQIRNLSAAYSELADAVLPELRRSRITINYLTLGRTDSEIQEQFKADPTKLSMDELLYDATLTDDANEKEDILVKAAIQYPSDYRSYNNLGVLAYQRADYDLAERYFTEAIEKNPKASEPNANMALITLRKAYTENSNENYREAARDYLANAADAKNYAEVLGNLNIANGQYSQAESNLKNVKNNSAALAQLLNKNYLDAVQTLNRTAKPDATTFYLKAIIAARTNQLDLVSDNLKEAISLDASYKQKAANDLEFAKLSNDAAFLQLLK